MATNTKRNKKEVTQEDVLLAACVKAEAVCLTVATLGKGAVIGDCLAAEAKQAAPLFSDVKKTIRNLPGCHSPSVVLSLLQRSLKVAGDDLIQFATKANLPRKEIVNLLNLGPGLLDVRNIHVRERFFFYSGVVSVIRTMGFPIKRGKSGLTFVRFTFPKKEGK